MGLFDIWHYFGFNENPYSQDTLGADDEGHHLLVGRDDEVKKLQRAIGSSGTHPSVEGPIGAGKSSLLQVTAYRMRELCLLNPDEQLLYLPARRPFQASLDAQRFVAGVYRGLAQTLIENRHHFRAVGLPEPNVAQLDTWLNSPEYGSWSGEATLFGVGGGVGRGSEPNVSEGFTEHGFYRQVQNELDRCFGGKGGGIICVLDNLELLQSTGAARTALEELRDQVFNIPTVRWVLCGSRGIVSRARSERLSGIFQAPQVLRPLDHSSAVQAIERRIEYFGNAKAAAPVTPVAFDFMYRALNSNLREAMSTAQEFSQFLYDEHVSGSDTIPSSDDRDRLVEAWLAERADQAFRDAQSVQPRHWQFFVDLASDGGRAGSSLFEKFGFNKQQQFTSAVTALVDANLMVREVDPDDGTRTVNSITQLGWLVHFHKAGYELPS